MLYIIKFDINKFIDEEGDYILVSSDAELMEVMKDVTKVDGQHLKLFIRGMSHFLLQFLFYHITVLSSI